MQDRFLDRRESAEYLTERGLKTSWRTLQKLATVGGGPLYRVYGGRAIYTPVDLDTWAEEKISAPRYSTSEISADHSFCTGAV
jgi:hypothetical protein